MLPDRDGASVIDMFLAAQQILQYAQGITRERFEQDDEKQAAILYRLAILGEAAKRVSFTFREQHSAIPWRKIAGLRDIIHDYDEVQLNVIWDVLKTNYPRC